MNANPDDFAVDPNNPAAWDDEDDPTECKHLSGHGADGSHYYFSAPHEAVDSADCPWCRIEELQAELTKLKQQDEQHWGARRSLHLQLQHLKDGYQAVIGAMTQALEKAEADGANVLPPRVRES